MYINTYMWNLEKLHRLSYLQSRNRETDIENKFMDTKGKEVRWDRRNWKTGIGKKWGRRNWEIEIDTYTLLVICAK